MKKKTVLAFAGVIVILLALRFYPLLASQRSVLEGSEQFTLYSLQPVGDQTDEAPLKEKFHRNGVLGKIPITDPKVKAELVNALYQGIEENEGEGKTCFNPRHGIRAIKGGRTVDMVICFECSHLQFHEKWRNSGATVTGTPQNLFDRVLKSSNVALGKRGH